MDEVSRKSASLKEKKHGKEVNIDALELSCGNLNNSATNTNLRCPHTRVCEKLRLLIVGVLVHEAVKP